MKSILLASILLVVGMAGCKPAKQPEPAAPGPSAPAVVAPQAVPSLVIPAYGSGEPVTLSAVPGKQQLVVFFAPWTDSGPAVMAWINNFQVPGVEVIPVVVDRRAASEREVEAALGGLKSKPYLADEALMEAAGGIRALPSAVLFRQGITVAGSWQGLPSFTGAVAAVASGTPAM